MHLTTFSIRAVLASLMLAAATFALPAHAQPDSSASVAAVERDGEGRTLQDLYQAALKEGGTLTVYAGGDEVTQGFGIKAGFERQFPGMKVEIVVDLSKYHDGRIEEELLRKTLKVDVAHLQTLHDFDHWASAGVLLPYKPIGWDQVPDGYKDPQGRFTALFMLTFANSYNKNMVTAENAPRDYTDFLKPEFKNRIVIAYPHDDDAVLYVFDKIIQKYGIGFVEKLQANGVQWVRGTQTPRDAVEAGKYAVATGTSGSFAPAESANTRFVLPKSDPFLTWAQTGAIFKDAKHPAAARLYMSWQLSLPVQSSPRQFPLRKDVALPAGLKPLDQYNTSPADFLAFMRDRARVERLKTLFERLIGPVQGISPLKD
ncbi:ABC transporter substrate-binding protein [Rhizobacter sp. OV335]|jgi:ABC-type Fe3+ transport system substrate-binding protein|uniref:ABC transporter substrate-binding protein n=1 Tax=Rhizobacter sp. OV335 TaxID=1500264 RepID=UPI000913DC94|nr:extracellular solute-binding protein [Rhizobacter sp. OV335]SHN09807.1 ABC-type Fe3+ transport system, substrate-binding protein [Rhizobacter sp. OV335]